MNKKARLHVIIHNGVEDLLLSIIDIEAGLFSKIIALKSLFQEPTPAS
jgi:hypothetical protein